MTSRSNARHPLRPFRCAITTRAIAVTPAEWFVEARRVSNGGGTLLTLWISDERDAGRDFLVRALLQDSRGLVVLELQVSAEVPSYPSLASLFPVANRLQRAARDLMGIEADDSDTRHWLRHASWPDVFPLRSDVAADERSPCAIESYPFVEVQGDGVHEIAVGPVHAGIIEPGHFRFSVVGEKVLRLEERLGFAHKGIEKRFEQLPVDGGYRLAARISGDSTVAYSWAYCMALEAICDVLPPPRALTLRALALELERIANHLGDLGALAGDAGFLVAVAQFSRLKENLLRSNASIYGARYLFDEVIPGGVAHDVTAVTELAAVLLRTEDEVVELRALYDEHAGVQDRFAGTGRVAPELAAALGLTGLAGRASGQARDARCDLPTAPYDKLDIRKITRTAGDVAARVAVRFDEIFESIRVCRQLLDDLPPGPITTTMRVALPGIIGIGVVEGWRGAIVITLEAGADGRTRRCHPHDPSWQNWPAIEHAVMDTIVPDFPLINKSFNLAYSGHDL
jgi:Ni,Fe-hydrogenase III large subunit